jgi:prevent-host-death family protein
MFNVVDDITSIERLGTSLNSQVAKVKKSRRPLVITDEGEPAVVMLAAAEYQRLVEMAEAQAIMTLAEERSSDVMELEEAMDYIYQRLNLPRPPADE